MDTIREGTFGLSNTNKLVRFYPGATGLKTGYTKGAGYCMSATAEKEGMELIAVVMHCETSTDRFESAKALLEYGFANYTLLDPVGDAEIPEVEVVLGEQAAVRPVPGDAEPLLLEKAKAGNVTREVTVDTSVSAPVEQGQTLGTLTVKSGETVLGEIPLVAEAAVPRLTWRRLWSGLLRRLWMGA